MPKGRVPLLRSCRRAAGGEFTSYIHPLPSLPTPTAELKSSQYTLTSPPFLPVRAVVSSGAAPFGAEMNKDISLTRHGVWISEGAPQSAILNPLPPAQRAEGRTGRPFPLHPLAPRTGLAL